MIYKAYIDSGDPALNLKLGDVLYGIPIIVEAVNEKDAECKAIREFKDNFYIIGEISVTHLIEEWWIVRKQFKPVIKHDVVTQTYTIRDKNGVVVQVPDVIIDRLDTHYNTLEAQRIALSHSYREVLEENEKLEQIRDFKDSALKGANIKIKTLEQQHSKLVDENIILQNELYAVELSRDEAGDKIKELERENEKLKEENEKLKDKIEDLLKW